jgi:carotenoid cleavage dioxygenase
MAANPLASSNTQRSASRYALGNLAPVREEADLELKVLGKIPDGLRGAFYRNGPNPQFDPGANYHPFLGDGMIHGFWLSGQSAHYRNRYVRTPRWLAEHAAGRPLFGGLGLPHDPSVDGIDSGGANTHVVFHAGKLLALQELSNPFQMDPATLASMGWLETGGRFTAHPKIDAHSGEMLWFAYSAGSEPLNPFLDFGITDAAGRILRRDRFRAPFCSMVHDFMVTKNHVLFPVLPLTGNLARAQRGQAAFAWEPEKGAYLGVMRRDASVETVRWIGMDPVYAFHTLNAYEDGEQIHCDMMEYPRAPLFPNADGSEARSASARTYRWSVNLADPSARVKRTQLDDLEGEFPRCDDRRMGQPYRHGWFAANLELDQTLGFDALAHIDLHSGARSLRRVTGGDSFGEPVFVPRSADAPEGDGWVIAIQYRAAENRSDLVILNAQDIGGAPEAVLQLPCRVPVGFHGSWVPHRNV